MATPAETETAAASAVKGIELPQLLQCSNCKLLANCLRCGGCSNSWYCNRSCQKQHWQRGHKEACSELARLRKMANIYVLIGRYTSDRDYQYNSFMCNTVFYQAMAQSVKGPHLGKVPYPSTIGKFIWARRQPGGDEELLFEAVSINGPANNAHFNVRRNGVKPKSWLALAKQLPLLSNKPNCSYEELAGSKPRLVGLGVSCIEAMPDGMAVDLPSPRSLPKGDYLIYVTDYTD